MTGPPKKLGILNESVSTIDNGKSDTTSTFGERKNSNDSGKQKKKKKEDEPRIFKDQYIEIINHHFGETSSPILDIIGWHFLRVTNEIVKFNKA